MPRRHFVTGSIGATLAALCHQASIRTCRLGSAALEVCVFVYLADALQAGDLYVVGSENFADYRAQLLSWPECEPRLAAYCAALDIPERGEDFAAALKRELIGRRRRSTPVLRSMPS